MTDPRRYISKACTRLICYRSPADMNTSVYTELTYFAYHAGTGTEAQRAEFADTQTGRHDCRAAINIAAGVPLALIEPSMGHRHLLSRNDFEPAVYEPIQTVGPDGTYYLEAS